MKGLYSHKFLLFTYKVFILDLFACDFSNGNCGFKQNNDDDCDWQIVNGAGGKPSLHAIVESKRESSECNLCEHARKSETYSSSGSLLLPLKELPTLLMISYHLRVLFICYQILLFISHLTTVYFHFHSFPLIYFHFTVKTHIIIRFLGGSIIK